MNAEANTPVYFAALTLAIATLKGAADNARTMKDTATAFRCNEEMGFLTQKRDNLEQQMQSVGGA